MKKHTEKDVTIVNRILSMVGLVLCVIFLTFTVQDNKNLV